MARPHPQLPERPFTEAESKLVEGVDLSAANKDAEAYAKFREAAELGNAFAMNLVGLAFLEGKGTARNRSVGIEWMELAYETYPNGATARDLGAQYLHCEDKTKVDYAKALLWYTRGAEWGETESMRAVGAMNATGTGVAQDLKIARMWFKKAYDAGDYRGALDIAVLYRQGGPNLAADNDLAEQWRQKALTIIYRNATMVRVAPV